MKKNRKKPIKQSLFPQSGSLGGPSGASHRGLGGNPLGLGKSTSKSAFDPTLINPTNQPSVRPQRGAANTPPTRMRKTGA